MPMLKARRLWTFVVLFLGAVASVEAQQPQPQPPEQQQAAQQQAAAPPPPQHTGFKALVFDTAADFNAFPRRRSTWVILAIGGAAAAAVHPLDDDVQEGLLNHSTAAGRIFKPGKYIGAVPVQAGIAAGLYLVGRYVLPHADGAPKTNKVSHLGFDLMRAVIVSQALTQGIKIAVRRDRPTGECCAFPSGHASASFATASVLERHLGYRAAWPTLVVAGYVGASRLVDNRHFLSDVVFGSALGIASGWTVVGRHGRTEYALVPTPIRGGMAFSLVRREPDTDVR
jgi:membrane-associated phospholipid phosphatase